MSNTQVPTCVMLCGVGGQGTILAADLLARAAMLSGFDVKVSEIHGMAQRAARSPRPCASASGSPPW